MDFKMNLGCGNKLMEGYQNVDKEQIVRVTNLKMEPLFHFSKLDLEHDVFPLHWYDAFSEILAENFFCMISNLKHALNECHSALLEYGILNILVFDAGRFPTLYFQDPEHKRGFTREAFTYFDEREQHYKEFGSIYGYKPWNIISIAEEGSCLRVKMKPVK